MCRCVFVRVAAATVVDYALHTRWAIGYSLSATVTERFSIRGGLLIGSPGLGGDGDSET